MTISVGHLREQIDTIDAQLLDLLNRRAGIAVALGRHKREAGLELRDVPREEQILSRARELTAGPLDPDAVERLFRAILAESRRAQASHAVPGCSPASHRQSRRVSRSNGAGRLQCV